MICPTAGVAALPDLDLILTAANGGSLKVNGRPYARPRRPVGGALIAVGEKDYETGEATDARATESSTGGLYGRAIQVGRVRPCGSGAGSIGWLC